MTDPPLSVLHAAVLAAGNEVAYRSRRILGMIESGAAEHLTLAELGSLKEATQRYDEESRRWLKACPPAAR